MPFLGFFSCIIVLSNLVQNGNGKKKKKKLSILQNLLYHCWNALKQNPITIANSSVRLVWKMQPNLLPNHLMTIIN